MIRIAIYDQSDRVILSNFKDEELQQIRALHTFSSKQDKHIRTVEGVRLRVMSLDDGQYALVQFPVTMSKNLARNYLGGVLLAYQLTRNEVDSVKQLQTKRFQRLTHNIQASSSKINQEIYQVVDQNLVVGKKYHLFIDQIRKDIARSVEASSNMVVRILQYNRHIQNELAVADASDLNFQPNMRKQRPAELTRSVATAYWAELQERNIRIAWTGNETLRARIDSTLTKAVLSHMYSNIAKYAKNGTAVEIHICEGKLCAVKVLLNMTSTMVTVQDAPHLFDESYSGGIPRAQGLSGAGIGLFVVKELMENQGGSIKFNPSYESYLPDGPLDQYQRNQIVISFGCDLESQ